MRRLHRVVVFVSAALVLPAVVLAQTGQPGPVITVPQPPPAPGTPPPGMPPRDRSGRPQEAVKGTAVITGRVLDAETGQPLRRASVQAFLTTAPTTRAARNFVARTDDTGAYTIRELPSGVYTVMAQRGGYVMQTLGQTSQNSPPRRLTIEDRGKLTGIDFKLQPGGVIAGRVTDDAGEPAEGVSVRVLRGQRLRGRMRYVPAGRQATSDDLGNYRVYGLAPGEYILAADPGGNRMTGPGAVPQDSQGVDTVTTYAPGTPAPSDADRIRVVAGQATPIDIQLIAARVVTVSGRVVDSTGSVLSNGMVTLSPDDADVVTGGFSGRSIMQDGTFAVTGVTPGAYTLHVMVTPQRPMASPDEFAQMESAALPIVVGGEDLENLAVTTSPPSSVSGRVIVEGDVNSIQASGLRVMSRPVDLDSRMMFGPPGQGAVQDDFTVTLSGLRGSQMLMLNGLPRGWWVKAVRVNGQNAVDGFDFGAGRKWAGLEIVVNSRPSSIGGQVTGSDGQPTLDYVVLAYPQDYESRASIRLPGLSGLGTPDQNGGFVIENLRPGEYFVVALATGQADTPTLDDPDRLRELSQRAEPLTIREGEQQFLNLKLEP